MKLHLFGASLLLLLAGCGKADDPSSSSGSSSDSNDAGGSGAASTSSDGDKPWDDATKPFLTEKKMGDFVSSLKDKQNPFAVFTKGATPFNAESRVKEFDAYAKKAGFESGEEYMAAFTRIFACQTQVMTQESNQSMIQAQDEVIKNTQEALKKPDLTPEARQMYEAQVKSAQQMKQAFQQQEQSGLNKQDIEAYKKHRAAFEEAMKDVDKK